MFLLLRTGSNQASLYCFAHVSILFFYWMALAKPGQAALLCTCGVSIIIIVFYFLFLATKFIAGKKPLMVNDSTRWDMIEKNAKIQRPPFGNMGMGKI
jgi:hypothetical protein